MFKRNHARILKHHRHAAVYVDGRYMHVDAKVSVKSKRGRELARETACAILNEVGANEQAFSLLRQITDEDRHRGSGQTQVPPVLTDRLDD